MKVFIYKDLSKNLQNYKLGIFAEISAPSFESARAVRGFWRRRSGCRLKLRYFGEVKIANLHSRNDHLERLFPAGAHGWA